MGRTRKGLVPMRKGLEAYLSDALGGFRVIREVDRKHGDSCVLEVADATGRRCVAKRHAQAQLWRREVRAYRRWAPALGDHAPMLHGADEATRTLVVSRVPGRPARDRPAVHARAGALLRTLHESAPGRPSPDYAADAGRRLDGLLRRGSGPFDRQEVAFVRREVGALHDPPSPSSVRCHLDFGSHNWLVDRTGTLRVIDFAGAQRQVWVRDLVRLQFSMWWRRPALRAAFLDGYGRDPTEDESRLLLRTAALVAVGRVVWGSEHRLPDVTANGRRALAWLASAEHSDVGDWTSGLTRRSHRAFTQRPYREAVRSLTRGRTRAAGPSR